MLPPGDDDGALVDGLRSALEQDPTPTLGPGDRFASVLAPLILGSAEPALLFTVRAAGLSRHPGEISFPGGLRDEGEALVETALRETHEEVGIAPDAVDVIGALPSVHTFVSAILVVPFVGVVRGMPELQISDGEIDAVLTFGLRRLARAESVVHYDLAGGRTWKGFAFELDGSTIWGATGWMLHTLLETIRKETTWAIP